MKKTITTSLSIAALLVIFSGCDYCLELSLEAINLTPLSDTYFLDTKVGYKYASRPKEKDCSIKDDRIHTGTIQYTINKDFVLFNDTIHSGSNLWTHSKTKKYITYSENSTSFLFDTNFYNNSIIDKAGLVITLKAKSVDGVNLSATCSY